MFNFIVLFYCFMFNEGVEFFTLHSTFLSVFGQVDVIVLIGHIVQTSVFASIYDAWELVEHGDVVGRHNDSSSLLGDVFQQTDDMTCRLGVEVACRLIGNDEFWVVEQCPCYGYALLLAT